MKTEFYKGCEITLDYAVSSEVLIPKVIEKLTEEYPGAKIITNKVSIGSGVSPKIVIPHGHPLNSGGRLDPVTGTIIQAGQGDVEIRKLIRLVAEVTSSGKV